MQDLAKENLFSSTYMSVVWEVDGKICVMSLLYFADS